MAYLKSTGIRKSKKGRQKGQKNLEKVGTGFENVHGVVYSKQEKELFQKLRTKFNTMRNKQIDKIWNLDYDYGGMFKGKIKGSVMDFDTLIIQERTLNLQDFKTKRDFDKYLEGYERMTAKGYLDEREAIYKDNWINSFNENMGYESDIVGYVQNMKTTDFILLMTSDRYFQIGYNYPGNTDDVEEQKNVIRERIKNFDNILSKGKKRGK